VESAEREGGPQHGQTRRSALVQQRSVLSVKPPCAREQNERAATLRPGCCSEETEGMGGHGPMRDSFALQSMALGPGPGGNAGFLEGEGERKAGRRADFCAAIAL
jgi:hypothetical protein